MSLSAGWLKIDPNFDPLRKTPRFQKLVAGGSSPSVDPKVGRKWSDLAATGGET
ncbi:MAG: hypothetical protein WAU32_16670 [Thermoanaerobaculia bacterium]